MPWRVAAEIAALPEPRGPMRRLCADLARRVRLLAPLLDHLRQLGPDSDSDSSPQLPLADALLRALHLLGALHHGSKIYQSKVSAVTAGVPQTVMPDVGGGVQGEESGWCGSRSDGVEMTRATAAKHLSVSAGP